MNYIFLITGIIIVVTVIYEVWVTTLVHSRSGLLSEKLRGWIWRILLSLSGRDGSSQILNFGGGITITVWLVGWIFLFWMGNAILFMADPDSVINSTTHVQASRIEKVYFIGYVLSTMGLGDFVPQGTFWQLYTSVISFSGFVIISLSITYFVQILSAETSKRGVSVLIHGLGTSPEEIVVNGWNGKDFSPLIAHFNDLAMAITMLSKKHVAYPALHNFHSHLIRESIYVKIAALDQALTLLMYCVGGEARPHKLETAALRNAISEFIEMLYPGFIDSGEEGLSGPDLETLKKAGIPLDMSGTANTGENLTRRSALLLGMLRNDGWSEADLRRG